MSLDAIFRGSGSKANGCLGVHLHFLPSAAQTSLRQWILLFQDLLLQQAGSPSQKHQKILVYGTSNAALGRLNNV